jgi:hypothetical protein
MVLAKARLTEVIELLYFYQHLCLHSADRILMPCLRQYPAVRPQCLAQGKIPSLPKAAPGIFLQSYCGGTIGIYL